MYGTATLRTLATIEELQTFQTSKIPTNKRAKKVLKLNRTNGIRNWAL